MASRVVVIDPPGQEDHLTPPDHPDTPARVAAVRRGIGAVPDVDVLDGRPARLEELVRVHDARYVARVEDLAVRGGGWLDVDTWVAPGTFGAARRAAGAGLSAIEVLAGTTQASAAFVVSRPPGHHAGRESGRGFCIFNNVVVAAAELIERGERVLVLDWDAHHGDGTQELLWEQDHALFVSLHQEGRYPGTGQPHERGPLAGGSTVINLPLPAGSTGDRYLELLETVVAPAVARFEPGWVLVSCGFDAHHDDPLADMGLSAADFGLLAGCAQSLAPAPGRLVLFLEGGYQAAALEESTASVLSTVTSTGGEREGRTQPSSGGPGSLRVAELQRLFGSA